MNNTLSWVKMVQAERGLTFDDAFRLVMSHHTGSFGRPTKSGDAVLIAEARTPLKEGQHPSVARELSKHGQLDQKQKAIETMNHVKRLAKIRQLMEADPSLSFDAAFTEVMKDEATSKTPAKASLVVHESVMNASGPAMGTDEWMWENVWT
jgi:hypothetical protein